MRDLRNHQIEGVDNPLVVQADNPTRYLITGINTLAHPSHQMGDSVNQLAILFQTGDPRVVGINGVTMEALLAVVADRLEEFQKGPWPAAENQVALEHTQKALEALHARTRRWQQVHMPAVTHTENGVTVVNEGSAAATWPTINPELWKP